MKTWGVLLLLVFTGCATSLPEEHHSKYRFPSDRVYVNLPTGADANRHYEVLGWVKSRAEFATFEQDIQNNPALCRNYYNKAARELLKQADGVGADAVIQVRSVVMLLNGKFETYPTPECADDGQSGEILLRGIAIRYKAATDRPSGVSAGAVSVGVPSAPPMTAP